MSVTEEERLARVGLSLLLEPGHPRLGLVADLGAQHLLDLLVSARPAATRARGLDPEARADLAERARGIDAESTLERATAAGLRFVVPGDPEWPDGLADLAHGPVLHERGGVPVGLWVKGPRDLAEVTASSVAVVGSRSATTYGAGLAGEIAATLAGAGWSVVSGAAFGIDQAAHRGALAAHGPTVAVLACGADRCYPAAHRPMLDYIAETGTVVSEAPPGFSPTRIRFLARNRLIAALSRGTVVVEAALRSGALNTAGWAAGLGRVVMGTPGPVTSAPSTGVHQLIRSRDALLVTRGEEVLEAVGPAGAHLLPEPREPARPRDLLDHRTAQVLDAVPVLHGVEVARIARTCGLSATGVATSLQRLLEAGLVEHAAGRWRLADPA